MCVGHAADANKYGSTHPDDFDAFAGHCAYSRNGEDDGGLAT